VAINDRCVIRTREGHRVVVVSGVALAQYAVGDRMAEACAMVSLVEQGWADQDDVARAFGCSARTLRRHQRRFEAGGLAAAGRRLCLAAASARPSALARPVGRGAARRSVLWPWKKLCRASWAVVRGQRLQGRLEQAEEAYRRALPFLGAARPMSVVARS
jgi:hypothetical protein